MRTDQLAPGVVVYDGDSARWLTVAAAGPAGGGLWRVCFRWPYAALSRVRLPGEGWQTKAEEVAA